MHYQVYFSRASILGHGDPCCGGENWEVRQSRLLISAMLWGEEFDPKFGVAYAMVKVCGGD